MVSGEVILLIIVTLINLSLWFIFFFKLKSSFSPQALLSDIKNEVEKLIIEINKTTLEDVTLIEERSLALKALVEDTDKRMMLLQGQASMKKREKEVLERLSSKKTVPPDEKKALDSYKKMNTQSNNSDYSESVQLSIDFDSYRIERSEEQVLNQGFVENAIEAQTIESDQINLPEIAHIENSPITEVPFKQKVLELAAKDFSSDYIANKLGCTLTEVQLVIDLYS